MKETCGLTIPRKFVKLGILTKNTTFAKNGSMIDAKKMVLPYQIEQLRELKRGILFGVTQDNVAIDLVYEGKVSQYPIMDITPDFSDKQKKCNGFAIINSCSLEPLLKYYGFDDVEDINSRELDLIGNFLVNKRKINELASIFAYDENDEKKNNRLDYIDQLKFARNYYKYSSQEKCNNEQLVFSASLFYLITQNYKLGYIATDEELILRKKLR